MTVNTKYFKKFPLNYGPETRRWYASIIPTSSAGTIPVAEIRESHNISSVRRLAGGSYEFVFVESPLSATFTNPVVVHSGSTPGYRPFVVETTTTGSRVVVETSGSVSHDWNRLDVEFWGRWSR